MGKNIVFCADGTWNHPGDPAADDQNLAVTNVFKLFLKLQGADEPGSTLLAKEQERRLEDGGTLIQIAKYIHGVGDSDNFAARLLGGGFGEGLIARIVRGYTFVSRNYAPGDRIYLVGFSRGAYTARALAGLISAKGLLPPDVATEDNKDEAYRQGAAVWYAWRREVLAGRPDPLKNLAVLAHDLPHFLFEPPPVTDLVRAPIETVAVWDTVGAYGIPQYDDHRKTIDAFQFADTKLSDNVNHGRHAVSIDEQRGNFTPTLWQPDPARITQVLFPGGHADVGGGYAQSQTGLSDCSLKWMTRELKALGVKLGPPRIAERPDPSGVDHEEWLKPLWAVLPHGPREIPRVPNLCLSQAVLRRKQATLATPYSPTNIASYLAPGAGAAGLKVIPLDDPEDEPNGAAPR